MDNLKVLVTGTFLSKSQIEVLRKAGLKVDHRPEHLDEKALVRSLSGVDAYLLGGVELAPRSVLEKCPQLQIIAVVGVGYGSFVDAEAATDFGIAITNTPDTNVVSVAELTVGHILNLRRHLTSLNNQTKQGRVISPVRTSELAGATVGIIGLGAIGSRVARILYHGFGTRVIYHSRHPRPELESEIDAAMFTLENLLKESDIVIVMTPTTPETIGLIGEKEIRRMRQTSLLINTARAHIVDGHALFQALSTGSISGAAFDGYYVEPVPTPDQDEYRLLSLPDERFILTPHVGAHTKEAVERMSTSAINSLLSFLASGTAEHIVNHNYKLHKKHNHVESL